jgi:tripartite-type tricarboxylate transporter receptor subunit TctC
VLTIAESGYPGYGVTLWYGLIDLKRLPADIVAKHDAEVNKALAKEESLQKLKNDGAIFADGTASQFQSLIRKDVQM